MSATIPARTPFSVLKAPASYDAGFFDKLSSNIRQAVQQTAYPRVIADYAVKVTDVCVFADATDGAINVVLSNPTRVAGLLSRVKNVGSANAVTVVGTIDGVANVVLGPLDRVTVMSDGIGWRTISSSVFIQPYSGATSRSIRSKLAERISVFDFNGVVGNGTHDDSAGIQAAINGCRSGGIGLLWINPGFRYRCASGLTSPFGLTLDGGANPAGGINGQANGCAAVLHDFVGPMVTFNGADGLPMSSGGGAKNLRVVQINGSPATTGGVGSAFAMTGIDASHYSLWFTLSNLVIEEQYTISAPWTWAIEIDGQSWHTSNITIRDVGTHTSGDPAVAGAIRLNGAEDVVLHNVQCNNTGSLVSIGDTDDCPQITMSMCNVGSLVLDRTTISGLVGGTYRDITNTINTSWSLRPDRFVNATTFVDNSGGNTGLDTFDVPSQTWIRTP